MTTQDQDDYRSGGDEATTPTKCSGDKHAWVYITWDGGQICQCGKYVLGKTDPHTWRTEFKMVKQ